MAVLEAGEYGVISSVGNDGQPYGIPVSYAIHEGAIHFHSAMEGRKIDNFRANEKVSFCVIGKTEVLPEKFSTRYESVVVFGKITVLEGEEKTRSLQSLITKYSPEHINEGDEYIQALHERTKAISISIDEISGKARR